MRALSWTLLLWHFATLPSALSRKPHFSRYPEHEVAAIRGLKERSFRSYRRLQMEEDEKCSMGMRTCPPSQAPSVSLAPSFAPSPVPSSAPTISPMPTASLVPSAGPTQSPAPSSAPSAQPSSKPSLQPSAAPSSMPSLAPSTEPSISIPPTWEPSPEPSFTPSLVPSTVPSIAPSSKPSQEPSVSFIPTISSEPTMAPTASAMPTVSPAPSNMPSTQPSMAPTESPEPTTSPTETPTQMPSIDPFAFDTTIVAGDDGSSYLSTCRMSIPDDAIGLQEQLLSFRYNLNLEPGSNVTFEVDGVELRLHREVADGFLTCDFSQDQDFYTHKINSLPRDSASDTNQTCSEDEMIENANCFKVDAGFTATIFYMPGDRSNRRLQSDTITDRNVAEVFFTFLELVFQSGRLGSPKVVGMTFESFVNTLPPTFAPTLPPGERGSTSPTPGAITGYAVAAGAGIVLLIAGVLWMRSREEKGENDRDTSRGAYSQHQEAEADFPVEERTEDLATHLTSQYPTSDADEPTDEQGFLRSVSKEEPRKAYVFGEDENSFDDDFAQVLETNMGTEEVQDPIFISTGTSPARSHFSSQTVNSGETPIDFDPSMIPVDYDMDDTVDL